MTGKDVQDRGRFKGTSIGQVWSNMSLLSVTNFNPLNKIEIHNHDHMNYI